MNSEEAEEVLRSGITNWNFTWTSNVTTFRNDSHVLPEVKQNIAVASRNGWDVGEKYLCFQLAVSGPSGASWLDPDADIFGSFCPYLFNVLGDQLASDAGKRENIHQLIVLGNSTGVD